MLSQYQSMTDDYNITLTRLSSHGPVMWSETVGLRTRPVWDQKYRTWSWSCRSGVVLWNMVLSCSSSWWSRRTQQLFKYYLLFVCSVLTSLLWRSTVAFTCLKVKSAKCLCLRPVVLVFNLSIWSCLHHWYGHMQFRGPWLFAHCNVAQ